MSEKVQYIIVGAIVVAVCLWMVWKVVKAWRSKGNSGGGSCCGCALKDACTKLDKEEKKDC